jgi:hypothetical protein
MKRRQFLAGSITIPALGAGIATASIVRDPHPEWFHQWRKARDDWDEAAKLDDNADGPACVEAYDRQMSLGDMIANRPAKTMAGLEAQLEWYFSEYGDDIAAISGTHVRDMLSDLIANMKALPQVA